MNDKPPLVDFSTRSSELQSLFREREKLRNIAADIRSTMQNVTRFNAEGAYYAGIAAVWAATLMTAEICKLGLAAADRRANLLFSVLDKRFAQANKLLKFLGMSTITTKDDVLKGLDPDLRNVAQMTQSVQQVRDILKKWGVRENKETKLVLDLAIAMTQDTLLIMQAMNLQQHVNRNTAAAQVNIRESLARVNRRILRIDAEMSGIIDRARMHANLV